MSFHLFVQRGNLTTFPMIWHSVAQVNKFMLYAMAKEKYATEAAALKRFIKHYNLTGYQLALIAGRNKSGVYHMLAGLRPQRWSFQQLDRMKKKGLDINLLTAK